MMKAKVNEELQKKELSNAEKKQKNQFYERGIKKRKYAP